MTSLQRQVAPRRSGRPAHLKSMLDDIARQCNFSQRIAGDPIEFLYRYHNPRDIEVAGFIAAVLAYGKVDLFKAVVERILSPMGSSPSAFLARFSKRRDARLFEDIYYRFNTSADILLLLQTLHRLLARHGSVEAAFCRNLNPDAKTVEDALVAFVADIHDASPAKKQHSRGFAQFFPSPASGSACKRLNLFLRWMVRTDSPDFGIWKGIRPDQLVIPLDRHISRIGRCFGLTSRKTDDWKTAVEITDSLKRFDPIDPVKYDFALCHLGITQECHVSKCGSCKYSKEALRR
ncbi:MAG: hypothetical protein FD164_625 [Nitrospirae bacterium]|nr:MAG: hypothetical protein FD164_625 [Nitrospirota bacterium]